MAMDYTNSFAPILKYDKNDDGTLMVYGNATDDTLDLDQQICDPKWLDEAMPQWFKSGGNIREMHGPSAAGVAKEYEAKGGKHIIGVHVVDPIAVKKVEARVYTGFSVGIKSPRVVRDTKAANGRIIDGQIIEVSLVDRPANPSAKLILAKSVEGESSLVQVEELHEYKAPLPSDVFKTEKGSKMEKIKQITELAKSLTTVDSEKFDATLFDNARRALAELIASEAAEMTEGHDERHSLSTLVNAVYSLMDWYEGEEREGEVVEMEEMLVDKAVDGADADGEAEAAEEKALEEDCEDGKCGKCSKCMSDKGVEAPDSTQMEETDQAHKSADAEEVVEEEKNSEVESSDEPLNEAIEKAVKRAMESYESKVDTLRKENESLVEKSAKLEEELATALSKAAAGGPKRTGNAAAIAVSNEYLVKALTYKAKADATTDPVLAKGYRDLHEEFLAKANGKVETK